MMIASRNIFFKAHHQIIKLNKPLQFSSCHFSILHYLFQFSFGAWDLIILKFNFMKRKESIILNHVSAFKNWLKANYSPEQIRKKNFDDAGYPKWDIIESDLEVLFKSTDITTLSKKELDGLIYLIARNWDISNIISWLYKGSPRPFSEIGLSENQFLFLLPYAIASTEEDAKYQFAGAIRFLKDTPNSTRWEYLLKLYDTGKEYTKRTSLYSLFELHYPDIENLVLKSWKNNKDEFHQIGCLDLLFKLESSHLKICLSKAKKFKKYSYLQDWVTELDRKLSL